MSHTPAIPARRVLLAASLANARAGHENAGFLSPEHGFMPAQPPRLALPPSHRAWDELAAQLPELARDLCLRAAVDALPELPAGADALPDDSLLRAAALLGILAHAYYHIEAGTPTALPTTLTHPWQTVARRLGRAGPHLSYIDLIVSNWRLLDAAAPDPRRVENMALLIPTVDTREERIFYLTQVEILERCAPVLGAVLGAQEAAARDDADALEQALALIATRLTAVAQESLAKIDPHPASPFFVDPLIWAKTVAPLAVPIFPGVQGPSGTTSPIFSLLDAFFGRSAYRSQLGQEMLQQRALYPPHWRDLLEAVGQVSVRDYVERRGLRALSGAFQAALDAYAGEYGFLGRHRLKVYGYLELAFKVGRSVTIGGFTGLFRERAWDQVDLALEDARRERAPRAEVGWRRGVVRAVTPLGPGPSAHHLTIDVGRAGLRFRPGDRCSVLPESPPTLVARTLAALRATGDERVGLNSFWQAALAAREGYAGAQALALRDLLRFGAIRPLARETVRTLYRLSGHQTARRIVEARAADLWELWDLLGLLADAGFDPRTLWRAHPGDPESISWLVPPLRPRLYSLASAPPPSGSAATVELLVGALRYTTPDGDLSRAAERQGAAAGYLGGLAPGDAVTLKTVTPPRFGLPDDPATPLVLIAGGSGIAPFRSFLQAWMAQPGAGPVYLFLSARTRDELYFAEELAGYAAQGRLELQVALTRDGDVARRRRIDDLLLDGAHAGSLAKLLRPDDERRAVCYVCGRAGFAATVQEALRAILGGGTPGAAALELLAARGRYREEVYSTYAGMLAGELRQIEASELVLHSDPDDEPWLAISGRVYDLSAFLRLHPGGAAILRAYLGMDATRAYRQVQHHVRPEVDAQLAMYVIGSLRRIDFGSAWILTVGDEGLCYTPLAEAYKRWARTLYLVVEMENALTLDATIHHGATTGADPQAGTTALKGQLLAEVHQRFTENCARGLVAPLGALWGLACGLAGPAEDTRWLRRELEALSGDVGASGKVPGGSDHAAGAIARLEALVAADMALLRALRAVLRDGLRIFETHGQATAARGGVELLAIARRTRGCYAGYLSDLGAVLRP